MQRTELTLTRGDSATFEVTVTDDDGDPVTLGGADLTFTVRRRGQRRDIIFTRSTGDGIELGVEPGVAVITVEPSDTEALPPRRVPTDWDLELRTDAGEVRTLAIGYGWVVTDITEPPAGS